MSKQQIMTGDEIRQGSALESALLTRIRAAGLPEPVREYRFYPPRLWRFDLAFPDLRVGIECQGGIWNRGGHVRGKQYESDCAKLNQAALDGWVVLWFTASAIDSGLAVETLREILGQSEG